MMNLSLKWTRGAVGAVLAVMVLLPHTAFAELPSGFAHVTAEWTDGELKGDTSDPIWQRAKATAIVAYRQRTAKLYDRNTNRVLKTAGPRHAWLQAAYNTTHLAISITWEDDTSHAMRADAPSAFGDAAALELPTDFGAGISLPYIGMGDAKHPVIVNIKRAHKDARWERQFVAAGFGSLTLIKLNTKTSMAYNKVTKRWQVTFVRPLTDHNVDLRKGLIPAAFALWDGGAYERGGNKSVTRWQFIRLGKFPLDPAYAKYVSWGESGTPVGDAAKGEKLVSGTCIGCHHVGKHKVAVPGMAPGFGNIGGYGLANYLKESITKPSAVVIRQPNLNRHYNRGGKRSAGHRSYPSSKTYTWYTGSGNARKSKMPSFAHLPANQIADIVAYLKTLKRPVTTPAPPFVVPAVVPAAAPTAPTAPTAPDAAKRSQP
ncbi:MAG: c-type cytochrome [Myxococcales bacterium]|nr:c-type cytochrome [Myxococcales bacterium]